MSESIHSIAVMEPFSGKEEEFLSVLHQLYSLLERKNYSRDVLLRNRNEVPQYINLRHWTSPQARQDAQEDPEVHRFWAQLGHLCYMRRVHEWLDEIDWRTVQPVE